MFTRKESVYIRVYQQGHENIKKHIYKLDQLHHFFRNVIQVYNGLKFIKIVQMWSLICVMIPSC